MAKANKWGEILGSLSNALKGKTVKRPKRERENPFDIFPEWFKSIFAKDKVAKDRETNREKDGYSTGVETYLARKKAHKKRTSVDFNDSDYTGKMPFSSPKEEQSTAVPTNTDENLDMSLEGVEYNNPVISTKPTPTSIKMGVPRPGPSTFIQTARYNPATKRLNVMYTDGTIFPYYDVSPHLADFIMTKKSNHSPGQSMLNTIFKGHGTTRADQINDIEDGM